MKNKFDKGVYLYAIGLTAFTIITKNVPWFVVSLLFIGITSIKLDVGDLNDYTT